MAFHFVGEGTVLWILCFMLILFVLFFVSDLALCITFLI